MRTTATIIGTATAVAVLGLAPVAASDTPAVPLPERAQDDSFSLLVDDPAIVDPKPLPLTSWSRTAEQAPTSVISVQFTLGSPDCTGVHAVVEETPETVTVTAVSGQRPEAVGRMCTMIAVFGTLDVPLAAPLGDRRVLSY